MRELTSFELSSISGGYQEKPVSAMTPFDFVPFAAAAAVATMTYNGLDGLLEAYVCTTVKHPYIKVGLFGLGLVATTVGSFLAADCALKKARNYF